MHRLAVLSLACSVVAVVGCDAEPTEPDPTSDVARQAATPSGPTAAADGLATKPVADDTDAPTRPPVDRYGIASGIIHYALDGTRVGTETLYFTDFGAHEAKHTKATLTGALAGGPPVDALVIIDGQTQHTIDRHTNTGTTIERAFDALGGVSMLQRGHSLTQMGKTMLESMGAEKTGTRTVAGHACEVWSIPSIDTETCIKDGVTLELKVTMGNVVQTTTATKVELGVAVPPEQLALPEGVELTTVDPRTAAQRRQVVEAL